jgi:predicted Zn-dependent protease
MLITTECATAHDEFKSGLDFLRDRKPADALEHFRLAVELQPQNPYYLSFLGLSTALAEKNRAKALELCQEALRLKPSEIQLHLNLLEVCLSGARLEDAVRALEVAEKHFGADARIKRIQKKLGKRRKPVFWFLPRGHRLNRKLGQWRHRLLGSSLAPF